MKRETKLWLRKRVLMVLRAVIWHADEWLHRQEVSLREEMNFRGAEATPVQAVAAGPPTGQRSNARRQPETFQQWEARRSGIAVVTKKAARRQRAITASGFDLRFAR